MTKLGPIEVLAISFPGSDFNGRILSDVHSLIDRDIINVVDALLVHKGDNGLEIIELDQTNLEPDAAQLAELLSASHTDLITDEDVEEFAAELEPGSSLAVLVFEHEWAKPVRDSIVESGGVLVANLRVPGAVVDEVIAAAAAADAEELAGQS